MNHKENFFGLTYFRSIADAYKFSDIDVGIPICSQDDEDAHEWDATMDVEGGAKENPGCWSGGGTLLIFMSHCKKCGLRRLAFRYGHGRKSSTNDNSTWYRWDASHLR